MVRLKARSRPTFPGFHLISVPLIMLSPLVSRAYSFDSTSFSKYGLGLKNYI